MSRFPRESGLAILAVVIGIFVATGVAGRDFGEHWDEKYWQIEMTREMIKTGTLLPRHYAYPSLSLWINLAAVLPKSVAVVTGALSGSGALSSGSAEGRKAQLEAIFQYVDSQDYKIRLRTIYIVLSSLVLVWTYGLALVWGRSHFLAALAAAVLGSSWELSYHSRWIAQDALMAQFTTLCLLLSSVGRFRPGQQGWFKAAAVAAGLACGMKYTAALVLIPLFVAALQVRQPGSSRRSTIKRCTEILWYFGLTYLATTPGTVLRPVSFLDGIVYNWRHYSRMGHGGHTVDPGLGHGTLMLEYFACVLFSPFPAIALALFVLSLLGVVETVYRHRMASAVLLAFPVAFVLMFDRQRVMLVRNLLPVAPVLAVLAALGAGAVWERVRHGPARLALLAVLVAALAINAGWLAHCVGTIRDRGSDRFRRESVAYIARHPDKRFFVQDCVRRELAPFGLSSLANVTATPDGSDIVLLSCKNAGYAAPNEWTSNDRTQFITWFGPYEVNMNYYADWVGDDRVLAMTITHARANRIPALRTVK